MITENIYDIQHVSTWDDIKKLIRDNKKHLEYLDQYEGLDHFLGSGQYGKVFKIKGKDLTIKVTTDSDEIVESRLIKKAGRTNRFINIYEIQVINPRLAIKIQDLLYPLSGKNIQHAEEIHDIQKNLNGIPNLNDIPNYLRSFYKDIIADYNKVGFRGLEFEELDLHEGNLLQDKAGNLKIVDF